MSDTQPATATATTASGPYVIELDDVVAVVGHEALVAVADADHPAHAVVVGQRAHQPGDHVVEAGTQPAAGDDGRAGLGRVEEDLATGPAGLEAGQVGELHAA